MNRDGASGGTGNHGCLIKIPSAVFSYYVRQIAHMFLHWFVLWKVMNIDFKMNNTASSRVSPLNEGRLWEDTRWNEKLNGQTGQVNWSRQRWLKEQSQQVSASHPPWQADPLLGLLDTALRSHINVSLRFQSLNIAFKLHKTGTDD